MDSQSEILRIYQSGVIRKIVIKIAHIEYADDLCHEILLILLEKNKEELEEIINKNKLKPYVVGIAFNLYKSNNSSFQRKYRHFQSNEPIENHSEIEDENYDDTLDRLFEIFIREMNSWKTNNGFPYEKRMFLLFCEVKNKKEMERLTKIPYRSICKTIYDCQNKLKIAIKNELDNFSFSI